MKLWLICICVILIVLFITSERILTEHLTVNPVRVVTLYWAPWHYHSRVYKDNFDLAKKSFANSGILFESIEVGSSPNTTDVSMVPSIIMLDEHGHRSKYFGTANAEHIRNWVADPIRRDFT
jgi:hypothetical protein